MLFRSHQIQQKASNVPTMMGTSLTVPGAENVNVLKHTHDNPRITVLYIVTIHRVHL